jgi:hypothetical protein
MKTLWNHLIYGQHVCYWCCLLYIYIYIYIYSGLYKIFQTVQILYTYFDYCDAGPPFAFNKAAVLLGMDDANFKLHTILPGAHVNVVVKALCYKPEGRWFETQCGEFLNLPNPSGRTRPWGSLSL